MSCILFGNTTQNWTFGTQRCLQFEDYLYVLFDNFWIFHTFFKIWGLGGRRIDFFFFSPYSLKMAVFYLPGLWWIFIICNNERERPWGQEMSDLAESLTSALTLASHNMLCIFRPLHCWSLLTWQLLGWMVSPWTRRATQGEAGSGCMVFGWGWARTLFPTFSSVASINFSKAPISLCFLSHPDVL